MLDRKKMLLAALATALAFSPTARAVAQGPVPTQQELADRAAIEDLVTRYYNHFGGGIQSRIAEFYADDAEMILGQSSYKGIEAIKGAYAAVPADAPQRKSFALNILINNLQIKVSGDTATARMVFTEVITEKQGDAPKLLIQGREFDHFVKRNGRWLISKRQVMAANGVPEGWQD